MMPKSQDNSAPIPQATIDKCVNEYEIEDITIEQVLWLSQVLRAISKSDLGKDFALMGGSAIVFLYRNLYRFSTDLDLDFVGNKNLGCGGKNEIIKQFENDHGKLREVAKSLGMVLKFGANIKSMDQAVKNRFIQYVLEYPSQYSSSSNSVEIDLSYRYCHSVLEPVIKPWPIVVDQLIPAFSVQTLSLEELFAGKIIAILKGKTMKRLDFSGSIGLLFKRKIRHLYDTFLLADDVLNKRIMIDLKLLKSLILLFGVSRISDFGLYRGDSIVAYEEQDKIDELSPVVPSTIPLPSVKEIQWTVRKFLDLYIFHFSKKDYEFIEDFSAKIFRPQKIFPASIAQRIKDAFYYKEILEKIQPLRDAE